MSKLVNSSVKLSATPGTCKLTILGQFSSNISNNGKPLLKGDIKFTAIGGNWAQLQGCNGSGEIKGTFSNLKIEGKNGILSTDIGKCSGKGIDPATGAVIPCNCVVRVTSVNSTVNKGIGIDFGNTSKPQRVFSVKNGACNLRF